MNRFNQVIDQQYAPIPFQELMYASQLREKHADVNRAAFDQAAQELDKLKAMPGTKDYENIKAYQDAAHSLISDYSTTKAYDPNSLYGFKRDVRNLTSKFGGSTYFNNTQQTYTNMQEELANRETLAKANTLDPSLITPWDKHDSAKGVWGDFTPKSEASKEYTDKYFNNYDGDTIFDKASGTWVTQRTSEGINDRAEKGAEDYYNSANFRQQAKKMGQKPTMDLAKKILIRDGQEYLKVKQGGFKDTSPRALGRTKGVTEESLPDNPFYEAKMSKYHSYAMDDLAPLFPKGKDEVTGVVGLQIDFQPSSTVNQMAYTATSDPRKLLKVNQVMSIVDARKKLDADLADGKVDMIEVAKRRKQLDAQAKAVFGKEITTDNVNDITTEAKSQLGIDVNNLYSLAGDPKVGKAIDLINNGPGIFVPNASGGNKFNIAGEDGTLEHMLTGRKFMTAKELDIVLADEYDPSTDTFDGGSWTKLLGPKGAGVLENTGKLGSDGSVVWAIKTATRIDLDQSQLDRQTQSLMPDAKFSKDYHANVENAEADKLNRQAQVGEGYDFLSDLEANVAKANTAVDESDYSEKDKKALKELIDSNIATGNPYDIGEVSRLVERLNGPNRFMEAITAPENPSGDPTAQNPGSTAGGLYQIIDSTWKKYNTEYPSAAEAPAEVQHKVMKKLYKDELSDARTLFNRYDVSYSIPELTALEHFMGDTKAKLYIKTLKETGSEEEAQAAVDAYIKKYEDSTPPVNMTVADYIARFSNKYNDK